MSGMSTFNIGGLASGLDTNSILSQLMQLERIPIVRLQSRQNTLQKKDDAWGSLVTRLSALRSSADAIVKESSFDSMVKATSSAADVVSVSVNGTPDVGAVSLRVEALAYATQRASSDTFTGLSDTMDGRELVLHTADGDFTITPDSADTTLSDFVTKINSSGAPVRAQAVEQTSGVFKLVLTATKTGIDNDFTLTETGWDNPFTEIQAAANAQIRIGDPVTGLLVERSSNTVTDLISGVSLTLKQTSATAVTITTERDVDKAVARVEKFVADANALLKAVKDLTAYDADKKSAQPLAGDSTTRALVSGVVNAITSRISGATGDYTVASALGIETTKDGLLELDTSVLREALTDDFDAVAAAFGRGATAGDTRVHFLLSDDSTVAGTYAVQITQAAQVAGVTGTAYTAAPQTLTIAVGDRSADVVTDGSETLTQLVTKINDALEAEGITSVTAEESGGAVRLLGNVYGSTASFQVTSTDVNGYGLLGEHFGEDVAGTIGGVVATGKGQALTIDSDGEDVDGLVVRITAAQSEVDAAGGTLSLGDLTYRRGIVGELSATIEPYEGTSGLIKLARDSIDAEIELFQDRIDQMEVRLTQRELVLRRQFTALETAMSRLTSQGNWLAAQLSQLSAGNG